MVEPLPPNRATSLLQERWNFSGGDARVSKAKIRPGLKLGKRKIVTSTSRYPTFPEIDKASLQQLGEWKRDLGEPGEHAIDAANFGDIVAIESAAADLIDMIFESKSGGQSFDEWLKEEEFRLRALAKKEAVKAIWQAVGGGEGN